MCIPVRIEPAALRLGQNIIVWLCEILLCDELIVCVCCEGFVLSSGNPEGRRCQGVRGDFDLGHRYFKNSNGHNS